MNRIIAWIAASIAAVAVALMAVYTYRKGVASVRASIAARWTRTTSAVVAWFKTANPETA